MKENFKLLAIKVVAVAEERWSLTRVGTQESSYVKKIHTLRCSSANFCLLLGHETHSTRYNMNILPTNISE